MAKRDKTYSTTEQAMAQAVAIVRQHLPLIPGAKDGGYLEQTLADATKRDYLNIAWERSWGVGCDLSISIRHGGLEREETRVVLHKRAEVQVSWSSTGRGPAEAMAAIALYTQVAQLACLVQAVLDRLDIADIETLPDTSETRIKAKHAGNAAK
jgi:hypothetical protein